MYDKLRMAVAILFLFITVPTTGLASPWGAKYFQNVPLVTHDGKNVHFFDDLIKGKIVAINFIYTHCPDACPLETAQLVKVQNILGERLGKDVFFYSITIDPENDTISVLKKYKEKFGAHWTFLTGKNSDIIKLRKKLGLYIEEIQDGSNNHNVSMIIGNQATGQWMKRAPFENPYVLADQLGNWLTGWKTITKGHNYADAPELRNISQAEQIFRTRCTSCHSLTGTELTGALGPDLLDVTQKRNKQWLVEWMEAPDKMLKRNDPVAMMLYKKYNNLAMPNMRLHKDEALALLDYIDGERLRVQGNAGREKSNVSAPGLVSVSQDKNEMDVVAIMNARIREAYPDAKIYAGYMTLVNSSSEEVTLLKIESEAYGDIEMHEMSSVDGLMDMHDVTELTIPAKSQVGFNPGGMHLMLKNPRYPLDNGKTVALTLDFKSGKKQSVIVKVAAK